MIDWSYDAWPSGEPYDWGGAARGASKWDLMDHHVDLGCGRLKKGRIGVDRFYSSGVDVVMDLETLEVFEIPGAKSRDRVLGTLLTSPSSYSTEGFPGCCLPFPDASIRSVISHHCFEHVGSGFIRLVDEVWRVLEPGGVLRAITPLFPSRTAVEDPDHKRYFMEGTWETFCGAEDGACWQESFAVPYTKSRFELVANECTPPKVHLDDPWGNTDAREIRATLWKRA